MPWWGWSLLTVAVALVLGILLRRRIRYGFRVAKALASDERLPRPLRWVLRLALAMKLVPFPDLGIDEAILLVVGILLITVYRPTLRAILAESKLARSNPPTTPTA